MIICLDAGHGGNDPGAVANGMQEAAIALEVTSLLAGRLEQAGCKVILSRPQPDINPGINGRWQYANAHGADYFVSIHANAGGGTGAETFYFRENSERSRRSENFAHYINNRYAERIGLRNRGVKPDTQTFIGALGVLRHTRMPAILVELAFIDSPQSNPDTFILRNRRQDMAMELSDAMLAYFGVEQEQQAGEQPGEIPPAAAQTVTLDILGDVLDMVGFIDNGQTFVKLTEIAHALGYTATWDGGRRIPVISPLTAATENVPLGLVESDVITVCAEEIRLIQNTVHWESRGEDETGQIMVANVILNRLRSPNFPDTIPDVILAPGAFSVTQRPDFRAAQPSQTTIRAVQKALAGTDHSQGATFFHQLSTATPEVWHERAVADGRLVRLFDHGNHRFYKEA